MRRDPIVIVAHDPTWASEFQRQSGPVDHALAPVLVRAVEHLGSTAVPGLGAKPIVDMLAVVADIDDLAPHTAKLADAGWIAAPEPGDETGRRRSFCTPTIEHRTHHLHVVEERSDGWRGWLAFRDHLRAHPELAREYEAIKRRLADDIVGADPNDRNAYRAGKAAFITRVTARALDEAGDGNTSRPA